MSVDDLASTWRILNDQAWETAVSCIYTGWVRHHRFEPVRHVFKYRICMMYLDLNDLPELFDRYMMWSARGPAPARFLRSDYHGDAATPLDTALRDTMESVTGNRPGGPIRMLTHMRYWGYCFNPVTFYYFFDQTDEYLDSILAEITNTPWKERRSLVFTPEFNLGNNSVKKFRFRKDFHVSPFWSLDHQYDWRFQTPGESLIVHMKNLVPDQFIEASNTDPDPRTVFHATLSLKRLPLNSVNLRRVIWGYPLMTLRVVFGIHWQAVCLYLKRTGYKHHPETLGNPGGRHRTGSGFPLDPIPKTGKPTQPSGPVVTMAQSADGSEKEVKNDRCQGKNETKTDPVS